MGGPRGHDIAAVVGVKMSERLDWFPCNPSKLLGALASMKAPEGYVYTIVLLRIYESGGACSDTLDAIAIRTRLNRRVVSEALDSLFRAGRLRREHDGIHNPVADETIADSKALREERKKAATDAANRRWKKTKQKQQNINAPSNADALQNDAHLQLQLQDSLFSNENRIPDAPEPDPPPTTGKPMRAKRAKARCALPDGFQLNEKMIVFASERGFDVAKSEQMFLRFCDYHRSRGNLMADWEAAWRTWVQNQVEFASRNRPATFSQGGNHEANRDDVSKLGFAGLAARLRQGGLGPDIGRPAPEDLQPINRR